jgi:hypothetical protein
MFNRAKEVASSITTKITLPTAMDMLHYTGDMMDDLVSHLKTLPNPNTPNYKVSTAASAAFGLLYAVSVVENKMFKANNEVSCYLSLLLLASSTFSAVNQYAKRKSYTGFFQSSAPVQSTVEEIQQVSEAELKTPQPL